MRLDDTTSAAELATPEVVRRGRPPGTSARELELVALRLFAEQGFDETTVDEIAAGAGVSRRTFFRYFDTKANVLWSAFDSEVVAIRTVLAELPAELSVIEGVCRAVIAVNRYRADDVPELRARMNLIASVPDLAASASVHYDAWEHAIAEYVGRRTGQATDSLYPMVVGRTTLAACRAAYEQWSVRADGDLTQYLQAALQVMVAGFSDAALNGG
jgi:mycofactocin system transcriptional regulator